MSDQESSDRREAQPGSAPASRPEDTPANLPEASVDATGDGSGDAAQSAAAEPGPADQPTPVASVPGTLKPRAALRSTATRSESELEPSEASYSAASRVSSVALEVPPVASSDAPPPRAESQAHPRDRPRPGSRHDAHRDAPVFFVAGFWHRLLAALVDLAVIIPVALVTYGLVSRVGGVTLPPSRHYGVDFWLDLLLDGDPALITLVGLLVAVATIYVLVFQITLSHTPGMRVMKIRIVDQYGASPSTARAAARTSGYLASAATLGLGFIWIGFDSEKRGLHDWLSGTYVVRA